MKINGRKITINANGLKIFGLITKNITFTKAEIEAETDDNNGFHAHLNDGSKSMELSFDGMFEASVPGGNLSTPALIQQWFDGEQPIAQIINQAETPNEFIAARASHLSVSQTFSNNEATAFSASMKSTGLISRYLAQLTASVAPLRTNHNPIYAYDVTMFINSVLGIRHNALVYLTGAINAPSLRMIHAGGVISNLGLSGVIDTTNGVVLCPCDSGILLAAPSEGAAFTLIKNYSSFESLAPSGSQNFGPATHWVSRSIFDKNTIYYAHGIGARNGQYISKIIVGESTTEWTKWLDSDYGYGDGAFLGAIHLSREGRLYGVVVDNVSSINRLISIDPENGNLLNAWTIEASLPGVDTQDTVSLTTDDAETVIMTSVRPSNAIGFYKKGVAAGTVTQFVQQGTTAGAFDNYFVKTSDGRILLWREGNFVQWIDQNLTTLSSISSNITSVGVDNLGIQATITGGNINFATPSPTN